VKSKPGPLATLGSSADANARLIVWCRDCGRQIEADPAEQAQRYGAGMTVAEWHERLVCLSCGGRHIDMVVSGAKR